MAKYKKKPVVIEAFQITGENLASNMNWPNWLHAGWNIPKGIPGNVSGGTDCLIISTLEGDMKAEIGDYIIQGVKGELYPCKPDIFEATYEKVE